MFQKPIFCSIGVSQLVYEQTLFNHGKPEKIPEVRKWCRERKSSAICTIFSAQNYK